jgi:hypothetical protein
MKGLQNDAAIALLLHCGIEGNDNLIIDTEPNTIRIYKEPI